MGPMGSMEIPDVDPSIVGVLRGSRLYIRWSEIILRTITKLELKLLHPN